PDQREGVRAVLRREGLEAAAPVPIVPMRIAAVNGRRAGALLAQASVAGPRRGPRRGGGGPPPRAGRRRHRRTARGTAPPAARVVAGAGWRPGAWRAPHAASEPVPVSLEAGVARELGVGVGDTITWDVQGVTVPSRVASLREVEWARFEPNFFVVFPDGPLDTAP